MIGTVLGHYKILRLVGKGGMGEVYAAEDQTLGRSVAIKVLPAGLAAEPGEFDRLSREAKSIAALNHHAIVTVHSFEEAGGVHFITMELVDGAPLSSKIPTRGMPFSEVLRIGIEMADAVSAAHERGVIHRDLKPANVLIRPDGQIKILDFGLAKLRAAESPAADLPTQQLTDEGKIVGTVAYMSPEQAEGKPVDHRTDVFSLGVVLYEMATGQQPFKGDTSMSVLSAVLKDQPRSAIDLNPAVPSAFARVLKTCLQKDPERRYQTAKDLRNELRTLKEELDSGELDRPASSPSVPAPVTPKRGLWPIVAVVVAVAALAIAAVALWPSTSKTPAALTLQHTRLTSAPGIEGGPTLSPDGKWFLYASAAAGNPDIYAQRVDGQTAINLTKDNAGADDQPAYSPDGDRIAFRSVRNGVSGLYVMGSTGEGPRLITTGGFGPAWSPDGKQLVFSTTSADVPTSRSAPGSLRIVGIDTGAVTTLTELDALDPAWSPNGRFVAFWGLGRKAGSTTIDSRRDIWLIDAKGGEPWRVTDDPYVDWSPTWAPDGSLLYFVSNRGGSMNLWRMPMNPGTGHATGTAEAVTTPAGYVGRARLSKAGDSLVFESREGTSNIYRSSFDAQRGTLGPPEAVTSGSQAFRFVDPSPNGQSLVLGTGFLQQEDLYFRNVDGSGLHNLMNDVFNDRYPQWSPDGERIAFYSDRTGKYEIWTATPQGVLQQITDAKDFSILYPRWSPTGDRMTFTDANTRFVVVIFDPTKPWKDQTPDLLPPPAGAGSFLNGASLQWSPDGLRIAGPIFDRTQGPQNGSLAVYTIATRQYQVLTDVKAAAFAWLKDGRLLVGPATAPRLLDPATGKLVTLTPPAFGGMTPAEYHLSRDEHTAYYSLSTSQADIWLVKIGGK